MATKIINPVSGSAGADAVKRRYGTVAGVVVDTTLGDCDVLDIQDYRDIAVKPSASITSLVVYAAEAANGSFVIVDNIGTNGSVTVVAAKWNTLDTAKIGPYGFIKLVPNVDGTVEVVGKT